MNARVEVDIINSARIVVAGSRGRHHIHVAHLMFDLIARGSDDRETRPRWLELRLQRDVVVGIFTHFAFVDTSSLDRFADTQAETGDQMHKPQDSSLMSRTSILLQG